MKEKKNLKRFRRRITQPFELTFVRLLSFFLNLLPPSWAVRLGGLAGSAAFSIFRIRRGICMKNLEIALPEIPLQERFALARRSYANLGRSLVEILLMQKAGEEYYERHISFTGVEHVESALKDGKGVLAVTGHFGSWEVMAAAWCRKGYPLDLLVGHQKNKKVDAKFNELRANQGLGLIPLDQALRGVLRALKNNRIVALLGDQDARRGAGVQVEFFGQPTSVHQGAALFSIKSGARLICPFILRKGRGLDHEVFIEPHIEFEAEGKRDEDIKTLTQLHTERLEAWIRKYPDHWFWGHKRWKSTGLYDAE